MLEEGGVYCRVGMYAKQLALVKYLKSAHYASANVSTFISSSRACSSVHCVRGFYGSLNASIARVSEMIASCALALMSSMFVNSYLENSRFVSQQGPAPRHTSGYLRHALAY